MLQHNFFLSCVVWDGGIPSQIIQFVTLVQTIVYMLIMHQKLFYCRKPQHQKHKLQFLLILHQISHPREILFVFPHQAIAAMEEQAVFQNQFWILSAIRGEVDFILAKSSFLTKINELVISNFIHNDADKYAEKKMLSNTLREKLVVDCTWRITFSLCSKVYRSVTFDKMTLFVQPFVGG